MSTKAQYSSCWARLAPIIFITYSLTCYSLTCYSLTCVDRANYSIGSAGGLAGELGITGQAGKAALNI
jgi:hypothetical protein